MRSTFCVIIVSFHPILLYTYLTVETPAYSILVNISVTSSRFVITCLVEWSQWTLDLEIGCVRTVLETTTVVPQQLGQPTTVYNLLLTYKLA